MPKQPLYPHIPKSRKPKGEETTAKQLLWKLMEPYELKGTPLRDLKPVVLSDPRFEGHRDDMIKIINGVIDVGSRLGETAVVEDLGAYLLGEFSLKEYRYYAKTEGNPLRKFCCRVCGECAPSELLEEGRFPDRIAWLRHHYKEKHPSVWGKEAAS